MIAALVAEQELVDNGDHSASESLLGADDSHDDDSELTTTSLKHPVWQVWQ